MSYVDGVSSGASSTTNTAVSNSGLNQLDNSQTFLNLLVAQLENQDPDNPTDPTAFMTEIAQLTQVQSQSNLSSEEQTVAADSMLGQIVTGTASDGQEETGIVSSVLLSSSGAPQLQLAGTTGTLSLDTISQVYSASAIADEAGASGSTDTSA